MARESVTKTVEFDHAPAYPCGLLQVNAGIETTHSLGAAQCITSYIHTRLTEAVQDGMDEEEAYVHRLLIDMASALYKASGAEA